MSHKYMRDAIFNLESIILGYLGNDYVLNKENVANLLRRHGRSPVIHMALIAALTHDDADYRLEIVENTKKHPGGVSRLGDKLSEISRVHAVREFVERAEAEGGGTEAAVAAACAYFGLSRSSIFLKMRKSRQLITSLDGGVH